MMPSAIRERSTIGTGRRITKRAVSAQRPSSLGVIADLRTGPLLIRLPISARIGGRPKIAPTTASATTETPA